MDSFDRTYKSAGSVIPVYTAVKFDANALVAPAGAGERPLGIATIPATAADKGVAVRTLGYCTGVASGAISAGDRVKVAASGKLASAGAEAAGTEVECLGYADTDAAADGDYIEVRIIPHFFVAP